MRVYFDNCCFNRPFDDQAQIRVRLESEAKLKIQDDILDGKINLVWSYILEAENTANPFEERERTIKEWKQHAIMNIKANSEILNKAKNLNQKGFRSKDALHIACAISAGCNFFLTTDDKILNRNKIIEEITITDPIGFIKEAYS